MELRNEWDELCERVKKLRDQGYTVLQIEDETGIDYEDILWAIHQEVLLQEMKEALEKRNEIYTEA
jgi:orotate phosphoribosyltransferase-like protein